MIPLPEALGKATSISASEEVANAKITLQRAENDDSLVPSDLMSNDYEEMTPDEMQAETTFASKPCVIDLIHAKLLVFSNFQISC